MSIGTTYSNLLAVTPSDTALIARTAALYVGGAGDVTVIGANGAAVLFKAVPVNKKLPISCIGVKATGTTATFIVSMR